MTVRIRWTADRDGVAHAHIALLGARTACGQLAIEERHAWPTTSRCQICVAAVDDITSGKRPTAPVRPA